MAKVRVRTMRVVHTMNGSTVLFYSFQNPPHNGEMGGHGACERACTEGEHTGDPENHTTPRS